MDSTLEKERDKIPTFTSKTELVKWINKFSDVASYDRWRNDSELFKGRFDELCNEAIFPAQEAARQAGEPRKRAFNRVTVEAAIYDGTTDGRRKYAAWKPDKSNWGLIDHYANAMYRIREENRANLDGLFYEDMNMTEQEMHKVIWAILQYELYEQAPSRREKRAQAQKKREQVQIDRQKLRDLKAQNAKRRKTEQPSSTPGAAGPSDLRKSFMAELGRADEHDEEETLKSQIMTEIVTIEDLEGADKAGLDWALSLIDPEDEAQRQVREFITNRINELELASDDLETAQNDQLREAFDGQLSPYDIMAIERRSTVMNLNEPWWKNNLMVRLERIFADQRAITEATRVLKAFDSELNTEDLAFKRSLMDESAEEKETLLTERTTERDRHNWLLAQQLVDNELFQPQGHVEACEQFGLNPVYARFPDMRITRSFKFWQVVAIKWMLDKKAAGLAGILLCDTMGLGKTWEMLGMILADNFYRQSMIADGREDEIPPPRPHIVVTLPSLVKQWVKELRRLSTKFTAIRYHGNHPAFSKVQETLHQDHAIFNTDDESVVWNVLVTTPQTLNVRHGPSPLSQWRLTKREPRIEPALARKMKERFISPEPYWPLNLSGKFGYCFIDEAQSIKNPESASHHACKWLKPAFYVLATATPDMNSAQDIKGYVPFISPRVEGFGGEEHLERLGLENRVNPYELDNDHEGAILRLHEGFYKTFIGNDKITDPLVVGQRLRKFYQQCMIRRTFASIVDGQQIIDDLPALRHRRANCDFTRQELEQYRAFAKVPTSKLIRVNPMTGQRTWNWQHYRFLLLISTWLGFAKIHDKFKAEHTGPLLDRKELLTDICKWYCAANPDEEMPDTVEGQLGLVLKGAPKLRALMTYIRNWVVVRGKKMMIFASLPAQQVLLAAILRALNIECNVYHAGLTNQEKEKMQDDFNDINRPEVLIGSYAITSCGLNLQKACFIGAFLDPPPSKALGEQAGARIHRLGQTHDVDLVTFSTKDTFNDRQFRNNMRKAMPGLVANLSNRNFGEDITLSYMEEGEDTLPELGEWVRHNNTLYRRNDENIPAGSNLEIVQGHRLLEILLSNQMGTAIEIAAPDPEGDFGDDFSGDD